MDKPFLSIVIANYNYGRYLEDAIQSVVTQELSDKVEVIICDAASTDNSVDVIKKYANGLPSNVSYYDWRDSRCEKSDTQLITWWCSERDGGQSSAFNKGFAHARGVWLTWLNADDILLPGTINAIWSLVEKKDSAEWVTGNMLSFDSETGKIIRVNWGPHMQPPFLRKKHSIISVFGPTSFFRRTLYEKLGPIDENMHFAMDTELWARFTMAGVQQTRLRHLCWGFRVHEESKTGGEQSATIIERRDNETKYWREKTGCRFEVSLRNPWYLMWLIWRVIDGSCLVRYLMRVRYEGVSLETLKGNLK